MSAWNRFPWESGADDYIKDHLDMSGYKMAEEISKRFFHVSPGSVYGRIKALGLAKPPKKYEPTVYTQEHLDWLTENFPKTLNADLPQKFFERFGIWKHKATLSSLCSKRLRLRKDGSTPNGQFKAGDYRNSTPIGTEGIFNGYVWVKYADRHFSKNEGKRPANFRKNWMEKQKYIWQKANGELPEGYVVIFLDGNRRNFDLDNLRALPRSIHCRLCQYNLYTTDPELTKAAIKTFELQKCVKDIERGCSS